MAENTLKIDIRRSQILSILREQGRVSVVELAKLLDVTQVTIRNDLNALEREGHLERIQGGALPVRKEESAAKGSADAGLMVEEISHEAEKRAIARAAAERIENGISLFLGSGTTALLTARALKNHRGLNVVTNSIPAAMELGGYPGMHVILLGGEIEAVFGYTEGADAIAALGKYQAKWAVLSTDGICPVEGVTSSHADEAPLNRMMMERAGKVMVIADHSKVGTAGFIHMFKPRAGMVLITDEYSDETVLDQFRSLGVEVVVARVEKE